MRLPPPHKAPAAPLQHLLFTTHTCRVVHKPLSAADTNTTNPAEPPKHRPLSPRENIRSCQRFGSKYICVPHTHPYHRTLLTMGRSEHWPVILDPYRRADTCTHVSARLHLLICLAAWVRRHTSIIILAPPQPSRHTIAIRSSRTLTPLGNHTASQQSTRQRRRRRRVSSPIPSHHREIPGLL